MDPREYAKLAAIEDQMWYFRALHELFRGAMARRLPETARVLDAGCGTGGLIRRLDPLHSGWTWTGVDASPLALEAARVRAGRTQFVPGSVEALPFEDGSFDAVVSADVLYAIPDDEKALRECRRVLRPGGVIFVNVPALSWLWSYHDVAVGGIRRYSRPEVRGKLAAAGFQSIGATYTGMLTLPIAAARRKLLPAPSGGSDVHLMPAPVEGVFGAMMAFERACIRAGLSLPIGTSVFAEACA